MKHILVLVLAAACGSSPPPAQPTPLPTTETATPASTGLLGVAEISVKEAGKDLLAVHADGNVQIFDNAWKPIGKLSADGKLVTVDNKVGQLQADGSFTTPEGPAPFKLDGAALVAGKTRITIENGKLVGGDDSTKDVTITGADNDGTKRTTLLLLGLLVASQPEAAGSAVSAPGK
jgi:hypothetical protein